jgi:hypothetical protein
MLVFVFVIMAWVAVRFLGRFRWRICFECVSGAQRFCLPGATGADFYCYSGLSPMGNSVVWRGNYLNLW